MQCNPSPPPTAASCSPLLPLATALAAVLFAGERPSGRFWIYALVGAAIVSAFSVGGIDSGVAIGDIWLLLATVSAALGYAVSGRLAREVPGWELTCWALVIWLPASALAFFLTDFRSLSTVSAPSLAGFLYLGVFSQLIGLFVWSAGLARGGVARIGQIQLLQTFVTLFAAALLLGETVDLTTLAFAAAVAAVVALGRNAPIASKDD